MKGHMKRVLFQEKDHSYKLGKIPYLSNTSLIHRYIKPFDAVAMSIWCAGKELLDKDILAAIKKAIPHTELDKRVAAVIAAVNDDISLKKVAAEIRKDWDNKNETACEFGTEYHLRKEEKSYRDRFEKHPISGKRYKVISKEPIQQKADNWTIRDNMWKLEAGFYPELLVVNHELKIATQVDKAFISHPYASIDDYKTNKEIKMTNPFSKMKGCLSHLDDCNFNHYCLQMNICYWLLAQYGYKLGTLCFHWFGKRYDVPNMQKEVEMMMEDRRKELEGMESQLTLAL